MQRGLLTGIGFGVAMVIFTLQNPVKIPVKLLWLKFTDLPLPLVLVIAILIGVSITALFSFIDKQRLKNRIKRLQNKIRELEDHTYDEERAHETGDLTADQGITIEGEPGHKFFDY